MTVPGDDALLQFEQDERFTMATAMYSVEGMICESCAAAVMENVQSLSGVSVVAMDLVSGGVSPLLVTSGTKLGADAVRRAVEHVGFAVLRPKGSEEGGLANSAPHAAGGPHPDYMPMSCVGGVRS